MPILFILSILLGVSLVVITYILKSKKLIENETTRKLIHFAHALTVAGWPVFIGYWFIIIAEVVFLGLVLIAQEYKLLSSLRTIDRKTWGEFFFPLGVIVLALIAPPTWVFALAVILLGLADGAAAIIGKKSKKYHYEIFGHKKSLAGSFSFWLIATLVTTFAVATISRDLNPVQTLLIIFTIPVVTTLVENISPFGSDNLTVPLSVYFVLIALGII